MSYIKWSHGGAGGCYILTTNGSSAQWSNAPPYSYGAGGFGQNTFGIDKETKEQKVIRLLKGDFEKYTGVSYDEFEQIRKYLIENNPEKLI